MVFFCKVTVCSLQLDHNINTVLRIRIRKDPELLPGSGIIVPDPDPAKREKQINKTVNSGLFVLKDISMKQRMANRC